MRDGAACAHLRRRRNPERRVRLSQLDGGLRMRRLALSLAAFVIFAAGTTTARPAQAQGVFDQIKKKADAAKKAADEIKRKADSTSNAAAKAKAAADSAKTAAE